MLAGPYFLLSLMIFSGAGCDVAFAHSSGSQPRAAIHLTRILILGKKENIEDYYSSFSFSFFVATALAITKKKAITYFKLTQLFGIWPY